MSLNEVLEAVKNGSLTTEAAAEILCSAGYDDMGFAKLDTLRKKRTGFAEVVFCQGKTCNQVSDIFRRLYALNGEVLGTRASREQYDFLKSEFRELQFSEVSGILKIEKPDKKKAGLIAVCTAGTTDIPVAEEAAETAEFFGSRVERYYDIGVCGLQRVVSNADEIGKANCIVAVAGMEGALPSVLGGMVSSPIIAVPTSVGYGASLGGVAALLSMINSCANGIAVVNIDNGYGAGYMATQINRLARE